MSTCIESLSKVDGVFLVQRQEALENLFSRIGELVTLPESVLEILRLTNEDEAEMGELVDAILRDPAVSARILRQVNSSFYGLRNQVSDIHNAVTLLGLREIKRLAQTFHCRRLFNSSGDYRCYSRRGLWRHSVVVAHFSRAIAKEIGLSNYDECYLAGLLHDLGFILMDQCMRRSFCKIIDKVDAGQWALDVEQEILTFSHTHLGACVADIWKLPRSVAAATEHHHDPYEAPEEQFLLVSCVALANYLANTQSITSLGTESAAYPGDELLEQMGFEAAHWDHLTASLPSLLAEAEGLAA